MKYVSHALAIVMVYAVAACAIPTRAMACVVGTGTGASCTESALTACLPGGGSFDGTVTFNCGGAAMITVASTKTISADITIDGGGVITISGGNSVFSVNTGVKFTVQNLTIADEPTSTPTATPASTSEISVQPSSVSPGCQATFDIVITNTGAADTTLEITALALANGYSEGDYGAGFSWDLSHITLPASLAGGATLTIPVTFNAAGQLYRSRLEVTIDSNAANAPHLLLVYFGGSQDACAIPTETPTPTATFCPTGTPCPAGSTRICGPDHPPVPPYNVCGCSCASVTDTPTPTVTAIPAPCIGACNGDGQVTVDELLTAVNIALGNTPVSTCEAGDANHDGQISVDEILTAVNNALNGCGPSARGVASLPDASIASVGGTASVDVGMEAAERVVVASFEVQYDPTVVTATNAVATELIQGCLVVTDVTTTPGVVYLAMICLTPFTGNGDLFTITFEAKAVGSSPLSIARCKLNDGVQEADYSCPTQDGSISVGTSSLRSTIRAGDRGAAVKAESRRVDQIYEPSVNPAAGGQAATNGLAGHVRYYGSQIPVPGVTVDLQDGTGSVLQTTLTDGPGQFTFMGLAGSAWQLVPRKVGSGGATNAVSLLDALYALQAATGSRTLSSQQELACDVTGNGTVNSLDVVNIIKYATGILTRFPVAETCGSDWVFVPVPGAATNQTLIQPQMTQGVCQPGAIAYNPIAGQADNQDFVAVLFGDCTDNWQAPGPPIVSSTNPAINARGVAVNAAITATFSEAMTASTVTAATFTLNNGVPGAVTYSGRTAIFTPSSHLAYSTAYTATITTGVKDAGGNAMVAPYTWTFTTVAAPDLIPPTVSSTSPANYATGVAVNAVITVTFSETMTASTVTAAAFTLNNGVTGAVTYSGTTATFTPLSTLASSTTYTATITASVKDAAGNAMAGKYTWTFTTGAAAIGGPTIISLADTSGLPLSLLTITGKGFDPTALLSVSFSDGQGFLVEVPVAQATSTSVTVAVPPFVKLATGAFGPGAVAIQVIQQRGSTTLYSNGKSGFQIQDLPFPFPATPAGTVTLDYLSALRDFTVQVQSNIVGSQLSTSDMNGALANQVTNVNAIITQVEAVMQNPFGRFQIGSIKGVPLSIGTAELLNVDRLIMGILIAQSGGPSPVTTTSVKEAVTVSAAYAQSTSTCQAQVAGNWEKAVETGQIADGTGYFPSFVSPCNSVTPTATAINDGAGYFGAVGAAALSAVYFMAAAAGVDVAAAVALPAVAITAPLVVLGAGTIMVAGASGNQTPDAVALLSSGQKQLEALLEVAVAKGALLGIPPILTTVPATQGLGQFVENVPEPLIASYGLYAAGMKLIEVFGATVAAPSCEFNCCLARLIACDNTCTTGTLIQQNQCLNACDAAFFAC